MRRKNGHNFRAERRQNHLGIWKKGADGALNQCVPLLQVLRSLHGAFAGMLLRCDKSTGCVRNGCRPSMKKCRGLNAGYRAPDYHWPNVVMLEQET